MHRSMKTVLIVEDNELNMKLFHDLLTAHGYATLQTRHGMEALKLAREHRPDLILMDIQLPEVSGLEVTKWLKDDDELRNIPVIAFSTDASVAARGVYLLSFLPESDVKRIVDFSISRGKRSFAALLPDNAYGAVIEAAFQQEVARRGGRVIALEKYPLDPARMGEAVRRIAQASNRADAIFIPDGADAVPQVVQQLVANNVNLRRVQLLGTGLWDEQRIFETQALAGGWYAAPDNSGFRSFAQRYRARYGQEPVRTATLAYDAVALVAALVKTQGAQRFSEQILTNASGFAGIDGVFRFKSDGTNERGLAVLRVAPGGGQPVSPAPKAF